MSANFDTSFAVFGSLAGNDGYTDRQWPILWFEWMMKKKIECLTLALTMMQISDC